MYEITKEIEFDAGHRVPLHASKCKNPHGHRYRVQAGILGELITEGPESGMVRDFSIVKELLTEYAHDKYDHGFIVADHDELMLMALGELNDDDTPVNHEAGEVGRWGWKVIVVPFVPTAECLAKAIYDDVKPHLPGLQFIRLWETPTSMAEYREDK
jgi:6-pyruvoyltetrahydropterin/6-carboxytetrahydropterin synthase